MNLITFLCCGLALALASWRAGMAKINPITVLIGIWALVLSLYRLPALDLYPIPPELWAMLWLGTVGVVAGVWSGWYASKWQGLGLLRAPHAPSTYDAARLTRGYAVAVAALAGYWVLQAARLWPALQAVGGIHSIFSNGQEWRRAYTSLQHSSAEASFQGGSVLVGCLSYLLFLGTIALVWAGYYAAHRRWFLASLPLALTGVFSLVLLQRFAVVYAALIFLLSWRLHACALKDARISRPWTARRALGLTAVFLAALVAVVLPIHLREPEFGPGQIVANVGMYLEGGTAAASAALNHDKTLREVSGATIISPSQQGHGQWTFDGLASLAQRAGLPAETAPQTFPFAFVQQTGPGEVNVYPYVVYFYLDFGWWGVGIISFLLGALAGWCYHRALILLSVTALPVAALLLTTLAMSFFSVTTLRDFEYPFLAVCTPMLVGVVRHSRSRVSSAHRTFSLIATVEA